MWHPSCKVQSLRKILFSINTPQIFAMSRLLLLPIPPYPPTHVFPPLWKSTLTFVSQWYWDQLWSVYWVLIILGSHCEGFEKCGFNSTSIYWAFTECQVLVLGMLTKKDTVFFFDKLYFMWDFLLSFMHSITFFKNSCTFQTLFTGDIETKSHFGKVKPSCWDIK